VAGTMPHAVFVETDVGPDGAAVAYAAELPGCAVVAATPDEAVAGIPRRAGQFAAWLRSMGEPAPTFIGDNWYEVERAAARPAHRAAFSLDELPPSGAEMEAWLRWLELAREELAAAVDAVGDPPPTAVSAIAEQDRTFVTELGASPPPPVDDSLDALYQAREALTGALDAAGPGASGVRRILRVAIADDLRLADDLRAAGG